MPNIINTQNTDSKNPVYIKNFSGVDNSRFSQAPLKMPKYSIHQELKTKDEFRKSVESQRLSKMTTKEKTDFFAKIGAIGIAVTSFCVLMAKKII